MSSTQRFPRSTANPSGPSRKPWGPQQPSVVEAPRQETQALSHRSVTQRRRGGYSGDSTGPDEAWIGLYPSPAPLPSSPSPAARRRGLRVPAPAAGPTAYGRERGAAPASDAHIHQHHPRLAPPPPPARRRRRFVG